MNLSDKNLITKYLEGDEKSLEFLIGRYLKPIYSFVYRNIGNVADAEDITQEVFVRVWKNLKRFKREKSFKSWIFKIAKNASIDFLRKRKTIPFSRFENEMGQNILEKKLVNHPTFLDDANNKNIIAAALESLSLKHRAVFSYRYEHNFTFAEIAKSLGESVNTVKSRYRRALSILKDSLGIR